MTLEDYGKIESACHSHDHIFIFGHSRCTYHGGRYLVEWLIVDVRIEDGPGRFGDVSVGLGLFFAPWRGAAAKRALTHVIVAGASRGACGGDDGDPNRESAGVSAGHGTPLAGSSLIDPLQVLRFRWTESGQVDSCISSLVYIQFIPRTHSVLFSFPATWRLLPVWDGHNCDSRPDLSKLKYEIAYLRTGVALGGVEGNDTNYFIS